MFFQRRASHTQSIPLPGLRVLGPSVQPSSAAFVLPPKAPRGRIVIICFLTIPGTTQKYRLAAPEPEPTSYEWRRGRAMWSAGWLQSSACPSLHFQGWLCYCKNMCKGSCRSSVMLLSQQIHLLQKRGGEQQSYIHLQPNLPLVITCALARADTLPAKNVIRTTTGRILLLNSLFSASFTGRASCKQWVGVLRELNTSNPNFASSPVFRLKFPRARQPSCSHISRETLPLPTALHTAKEPCKATSTTSFQCWLIGYSIWTPNCIPIDCNRVWILASSYSNYFITSFQFFTVWSKGLPQIMITSISACLIRAREHTAQLPRHHKLPNHCISSSNSWYQRAISTRPSRLPLKL